VAAAEEAAASKLRMTAAVVLSYQEEVGDMSLWIHWNHGLEARIHRATKVAGESGLEDFEVGHATRISLIKCGRYLLNGNTTTKSIYQ
jgi:hypothetical protein